MIIGCSGYNTDIGHLEELTNNGSYIKMDRFNLDVISPFEDRVNIVAQMCERRHADKMMLSHDANYSFDALPKARHPVVAPNWHYRHIHNDVNPALKDRSVTDEQLHTMLIDNPRRILERPGAYE